MGKVKKYIFSVAIVLSDMDVYSNSTPVKF